MENKYLNRTKIVATIGLVSCNEEVMRGLARAGLSVARVNMSHGDISFFSKVANIVRKVNKDLKTNIGVMTDTKGPEIRIGQLNQPLTIKQNSIVTILTKSFVAPNKPNTFFVYDSTKKYNMANDLKPGYRILVDDGKLHLITKTVDVNKGVITALALNTHTVVTNKRINLPDSHYTMPFLSEKDKENLIDSIKVDADYIALSFVNCAKDIQDVRDFLNKNKKDNGIQLIAKIETQQALDNIDEIIKTADGIMIARGDLALETPFYNIPFHEIEIIELCRKAGKPVIVATQMLDSLEKNLQPTRAEVTDVFFACKNGADATMLSGETASGLYPVQSLTTMSIINRASENHFDYKQHFAKVFAKSKISKSIKDKVAKLYKQCCKKGTYTLSVKTDDEKLIKAIAAARLPALVVITTTNKKLLTKFGCNYGIKMQYAPRAK